MLDTRLPMLAATGSQVNLADIAKQHQQQQYRQQQMEMQREGMDLQREQMGWQRELQDMKMDAEQAKAAREGIKDMAGAVQWADTPEKWAQVQQHYAQYDPSIASIGFDQRESALVRLGQMGEYLENTAPDIRAIEPGGSLFSVGPQGVEELVRANPGAAAPASPVGQGPQEGATATNPQTGEKIIYRNGQWQAAGGASGNAGGGF